MSVVQTKVKERPIIFSGDSVRAILAGNKTQTRRVVNSEVAKGLIEWKRCPLGIPGDRLWVRETWKVAPGKEYTLTQEEFEGAHNPAHIWYRAGDPRPELWIWKSPIFMPRWASRLNLEITGVRVERLQDIAASGARAEGITVPATGPMSDLAAIDNYATGWTRINGKRDGCKWDDNPFVWVIEFRRVDQ